MGKDVIIATILAIVMGAVGYFGTTYYLTNQDEKVAIEAEDESEVTGNPANNQPPPPGNNQPNNNNQITSALPTFADGDFRYAQMNISNIHYLMGIWETSGDWQPEYMVYGAHFLFEGFDENYPKPNIINLVFYIDNIPQPDMIAGGMYEDWNMYHFPYSPYEQYQATLYSTWFNNMAPELKPGAYHFTATVNGVDIRSNTFIYHADGTAEFLNDMPVPAAHISLFNQAQINPPTPARPGERGNLTGNTTVAEKDGYIYYAAYGKLYRMNMDGTNIIQIEPVFPLGVYAYIMNIHIIGDWIYMSNYEAIFRFRTDGSDVTMINAMGMMHSIVGDYIYYIGNYDWETNEATGVWHNAIYRIRTDGTEKTKLTPAEDFYTIISVDEEWIYYLLQSSWSRVFRVRTDGSSMQEVAVPEEKYFYNLRISDGYFYFPDNNTLVRFNPDTSVKEVVLNENCWEFIIDGDWIYFPLYNWSAPENEHYNIHKIKTDGSGLTRVNNDASGQINIAGDWIFYNNYKEDNAIYRIRKDGTERTFVARYEYE